MSTKSYESNLRVLSTMIDGEEFDKHLINTMKQQVGAFDKEEKILSS